MATIRHLRSSANLRCLLPLVLAASLSIADEVSFNRDVAPILAAKCYECHGPDEEQREAGLRLDDRDIATSKLDSGNTAIIPGSSDQSQLIRRILAKDDDRMPPVQSGDGLTKEEVHVLQAWIEGGATWQGHWAFEPFDRPTLPVVQDDDWSANPIDRFILAGLEDAQLTPARRADRYTLIRRLYFDLLGLPPSKSAVEQFVNDDGADAYENLVDALLASPRYGERWGRHWLDVARYGDSNGGDENHAYPLAHKYRDYVVEVFNDDLPYSRFIEQQLAGDLLDKTGNDRLDAQRLTATGYLAIGMKLLAEQDAVKKRADMIDEQIDTFGRTFLGLSLGCARCHDHKFDPIPTKDYYALAGIFHSSDVGEKPLPSNALAMQLADHNARVAHIEAELAEVQKRLEQACNATTSVTREAESFDRGNVLVDNDNYGKGIGIISDPGGQLNFAEYDIKMLSAGEYLLQIRYAAATARPGKLLINTKLAKENVIDKTTGSWLPDSQTWFTEGIFKLAEGKNTVRIESEPMMSHIDKVRLIHRDHLDVRSLERLDELTAKLSSLQKQKPSAAMVMAVADTEIKNTKVHLRGSHLSLGDEVPRRFLEVLDGKSTSIPEDQSGRLHLAKWLTESDLAATLTSRVIVNRVWHWHFGRGLVTTPDDFGIRGQSPTHPRLLDYLSQRLIEAGWSLKALHRMIVTSSTYRMDSTVSDERAERVDPTNARYWKRDRARLDAESIRDALLMHSATLSSETGNSPMFVKSQDPSPQDMQANLDKYEASRRRSVYLPVVRSNVYEFFTLFDFPNASTPVGKRNETTIPTQALWMMNSPFIVKHARKIAETVTASEEETIRELYLRLFCREPTDQEVARGERFLGKFRTLADDSKAAAWTAYCQTLLSSNDYLYLK